MCDARYRRRPENGRSAAGRARQLTALCEAYRPPPCRRPRSVARRKTARRQSPMRTGPRGLRCSVLCIIRRFRAVDRRSEPCGGRIGHRPKPVNVGFRLAEEFSEKPLTRGFGTVQFHRRDAEWEESNSGARAGSVSARSDVRCRPEWRATYSDIFPIALLGHLPNRRPLAFAWP